MGQWNKHELDVQTTPPSPYTMQDKGIGDGLGYARGRGTSRKEVGRRRG